MCYVVCIYHLASGLQSKVRYLNMNIVHEPLIRFLQNQIVRVWVKTCSKHCTLCVKSSLIRYLIFLKEILEEQRKYVYNLN